MAAADKGSDHRPHPRRRGPGASGGVGIREALAERPCSVTIVATMPHPPRVVEVRSPVERERAAVRAGSRGGRRGSGVACPSTVTRKGGTGRLSQFDSPATRRVPSAPRQIRSRLSGKVCGTGASAPPTSLSRR
jgi:hypothetical protein